MPKSRLVGTGYNYQPVCWTFRWLRFFMEQIAIIVRGYENEKTNYWFCRFISPFIFTGVPFKNITSITGYLTTLPDYFNYIENCKDTSKSGLSDFGWIENGLKFFMLPFPVSIDKFLFTSAWNVFQIDTLLGYPHTSLQKPDVQFHLIDTFRRLIKPFTFYGRQGYGT